MVQGSDSFPRAVGCIGLHCTGCRGLDLLGPLHYACSEPDGPFGPCMQVFRGQPIRLDLQRLVGLVEVVGVEERHPAVRVNSRKGSHRLALFNDVWTERPLIDSVFRSEHWGSCEPLNSYKSGPGEGVIVSEQLVLIYLLGRLSVIIVCSSAVCFFISIAKTEICTAQKIWPQISDPLEHLN